MITRSAWKHLGEGRTSQTYAGQLENLQLWHVVLTQLCPRVGRGDSPSSLKLLSALQSIVYHCSEGGREGEILVNRIL